jgi:hypothetical protein
MKQTPRAVFPFFHVIWGENDLFVIVIILLQWHFISDKGVLQMSAPQGALISLTSRSCVVTLHINN